MAEAVVEDRPGPPPRFYCHVCKQEFTNITQEYTCPVCSDGFIEELHDADPSPSSSTGGTMEVDVLELLNTGFRDGLAADGPAGGRSGTLRGLPTTDARGRPLRRQPVHHHHHHHHPRMGPPSHPSADGSPAPAMINAYDQLIRDFFAYVGVPAGGAAAGANGRRIITAGPPGRADQLTLTPMFFVGNPGDYVWGHDGLDSVITLMLNQLEPTGPPPMSAQKIDEIPKCEIGQEELDKKMQCSVCLEDFQLQEQCRKLPCAHVFHETCILPWLELHGTCPICRDTFTEAQPEDEGQDDEAMDTDAPPMTANSFENFLSDMQSRGPGGVMEVLASHLPRAMSGANAPGSVSGGAGVIGSAPSNNPSAQGGSHSTSSSHRSSNAISSQSPETTTTTTPTTSNEASASVPPRNNLNFHLDDGLD